MQLFFDSLIDTTNGGAIEPATFVICMLVALAAGLILAKMSMWKVESSGSFLITLAVLPAAVCAIIMMVNGNFGTGVAVAGSFALIRFRSAAGSAREIGAVFAAMGVGLMAATGYLGYAVIFALLIGGVLMAYTAVGFGEKKVKIRKRELRITIPEDLDYVGVFEPVLEQYTKCYELTEVKTVHMGSLFRLVYEITLREDANEKALIDDLRVRNGNLEIMLAFREQMQSLAL